MFFSVLFLLFVFHVFFSTVAVLVPVASLPDFRFLKSLLFQLKDPILSSSVISVTLV